MLWKKIKGLQKNAKCQQTNVEWALILESQRFAITLVKIRSGKNPPWMLNVEGSFNEEKDICVVLKYLLIDWFISWKGKQKLVHWLGSQN